MKTTNKGLSGIKKQFGLTSAVSVGFNCEGRYFKTVLIEREVGNHISYCSLNLHKEMPAGISVL